MSLKKTFSSDGKKCTVVFTVNPEAAAGATKMLSHFCLTHFLSRVERAAN